MYTLWQLSTQANTDILLFILINPQRYCRNSQHCLDSPKAQHEQKYKIDLSLYSTWDIYNFGADVSEVGNRQQALIRHLMRKCVSERSNAYKAQHSGTFEPNSFQILN